jgi:hypothetical protein
MLSAGEQVAPLIAQYGIDGLLLNSVSQAGLIAYVHEHPDEWAIRYEDADTLYAVRR